MLGMINEQVAVEEVYTEELMEMERFIEQEATKMTLIEAGILEEDGETILDR